MCVNWRVYYGMYEALPGRALWTSWVNQMGRAEQVDVCYKYMQTYPKIKEMDISNSSILHIYPRLEPRLLLLIYRLTVISTTTEPQGGAS